MEEFEPRISPTAPARKVSPDRRASDSRDSPETGFEEAGPWRLLFANRQWLRKPGTLTGIAWSLMGSAPTDEL